MLSDLLVAKSMSLSMSEGAYWRNFAGKSSAVDLEAALQLVLKLFTTNIEPTDEDVKTAMQWANP